MEIVMTLQRKLGRKGWVVLGWRENCYCQQGYSNRTFHTKHTLPTNSSICWKLTWPDLFIPLHTRLSKNLSVVCFTYLHYCPYPFLSMAGYMKFPSSRLNQVFLLDPQLCTKVAPDCLVSLFAHTIFTQFPPRPTQFLWPLHWHSTTHYQLQTEDGFLQHF